LPNNKFVNPKELKNIYNQCWSKETCHPLFKRDWTSHDRAIGQNDITALSIFSIFGGQILFCATRRCDNYFWNCLLNGQEIDLTNWPHRLRLSELRNSRIIAVADIVLFKGDGRDEYFLYQRFMRLHLRVYEFLRKNKKVLEGFV